MDYNSLYEKTIEGLKLIAQQSGIKLPSRINKAKMIELLLAADAAAKHEEPQQNAPSEQSLPKETEQAQKPQAKVKPIKAAKPEAAAKPEKQSRSKRTADLQKPELSAVSVKADADEAIKPETNCEAEKSKEQIKSDATYKTEKSQEQIKTETPNKIAKPAEPQKPEPADKTAKTAEYNAKNQAVNDMLRQEDCPEGCGILELLPDGYGFLRAENYLPGNNDIYISNAQIRRLGLRNGDFVEGKTRAQRDGDRYQAMLYVTKVNGRPADTIKGRPRFEDLTPIYPDRRISLEKAEGGTDLALRAIDLVAPIGRGQRGMIVSPPKAGKTVLLKKIANAITDNYPEIHLIVLLIDERPEEVTDMQRSINGEVLYSTFDEDPENHTRLSETVLERAQRLVEQGDDVVVLLDSITRLARAYNLVIPPTGRSLSGGLDPGALYRPKRFFGAARNIENGGSLTIIATALVDTGSRMDDIIFEEFKGTGNMELHLDRKLSERRIFPAIDLYKSGTRRDELLYTPEEAAGALNIRRALGGNNQDNAEQLISLLERTRTNSEFIARLKGWMAVLK